MSQQKGQDMRDKFVGVTAICAGLVMPLSALAGCSGQSYGNHYALPCNYVYKYGSHDLEKYEYVHGEKNKHRYTYIRNSKAREQYKFVYRNRYDNCGCNYKKKGW